MFDVGKDRFEISRGSKHKNLSHDMDNGKVRKDERGERKRLRQGK